MIMPLVFEQDSWLKYTKWHAGNRPEGRGIPWADGLHKHHGRRALEAAAVALEVASLSRPWPWFGIPGKRELEKGELASARETVKAIRLAHLLEASLVLLERGCKSSHPGYDGKGQRPRRSASPLTGRII